MQQPEQHTTITHRRKKKQLDTLAHPLARHTNSRIRYALTPTDSIEHHMFACVNAFLNLCQHPHNPVRSNKIHTFYTRFFPSRRCCFSFHCFFFSDLLFYWFINRGCIILDYSNINCHSRSKKNGHDLAKKKQFACFFFFLCQHSLQDFGLSPSLAIILE